jgi:hypothetical protein
MRNYQAIIIGVVMMGLLAGCVTTGDPYLAAEQARKQRLAEANRQAAWREQLAEDAAAAVTEQMDAALADFAPYQGVTFVDDATLRRQVTIAPQDSSAQEPEEAVIDGEFWHLISTPAGGVVHEWQDRIVLAQQVDIDWQLDGIEITSMDIDAETPFVAEGQITVRSLTRHAMAADLAQVPTPTEGEAYFPPSYLIRAIGRSSSGPIEFRQPDGAAIDQIEVDALIVQASNAMESEEITVELEHLHFTAEYSMASEQWGIRFSSPVQRLGYRITPREGLDESVREFIFTQRVEAE